MVSFILSARLRFMNIRLFLPFCSRFIYSGWTSIALFMCMYALHSCLLNYIAYSYNRYKALLHPFQQKIYIVFKCTTAH